MPSSSPRTPWQLVVAMRTLDDRDVPIAEVWRRACKLAGTLGATRPSYEQVRRLVHRERELADLPGSAGLIVDAVLQLRAPVSALDEAIERSLDRRSARAALDDERRWRPTV